MPNIVTHIGTDFKWLAYRYGENAFTVTMTLDGNEYDITNHAFTLNIRRPGRSEDILVFTEGDGLTNGGSTGVLTVDLTTEDIEDNLPAADYFYEITYEINAKIYPLIQGFLSISAQGNPLSATTSLTAELHLEGTNVDAAIQLVGGGITAEDFLSFLSTASVEVLTQIGNILAPYIEGGGAPSDGVIYDDGTEVLYDDDTNVLYEL